MSSAENTIQHDKVELNPISQKGVPNDENDQLLADCIVNPCNLHLNNCSFQWTRIVLIKMSARVTISITYVSHGKSIAVFTNLSIRLIE